MALALSTIAAFTPPARHWWKWSDDGPAWSDGRHIAFLGEFRAVLDDLAAAGGLPPAGAVLLVMAACAPNWKDEPPRYGLMMAAAMELSGGAMDRREDLYLLQEAWRGLDAVHNLPADLRAGMAGKLALCFLLLDGAPHRLGAKAARLALDEFDRVPLADLAGAREGEGAAAIKLPGRSQLLRRDIEALAAGFGRIGAAVLSEPAAFAARVRTGAAEAAARAAKIPVFLPAPAAAAKAKPKELPKPPQDLLTALVDGGGEAGRAAQMARRMLAALSLSRPAGRPEDHPEGGFADLANRGNPERLLLSELAHDPDVLAARIVHGEAMYLKREVPPGNPAMRRVLCLDATLRQWGSARLVTMALGLALREQALRAKGAKAPGAVEVFQSAHGRWRKVPLHDAPAVQNALAYLDTNPFPPTLEGLDLGDAKTPAEVFLITGPAAWAEPAQVAALRQLAAKSALCAAAVADREGNFCVHAVAGLGSRVLAKGRVEVGEAEREKEVRRMPLVPGQNAKAWVEHLRDEQTVSAEVAATTRGVFLLDYGSRELRKDIGRIKQALRNAGIDQALLRCVVLSHAQHEKIVKELLVPPVRDDTIIWIRDGRVAFVGAGGGHAQEEMRQGVSALFSHASQEKDDAAGDDLVHPYFLNK